MQLIIILRQLNAIQDEYKFKTIHYPVGKRSAVTCGNLDRCFNHMCGGNIDKVCKNTDRQRTFLTILYMEMFYGTKIKYNLLIYE